MKHVMICGSFDVLRVEDIELFKGVKAFGDYLIVGLEGDVFGNCQREAAHRKAILETIRFVDEVVIYDALAELEVLVETLQIDEVIGSRNQGVMVDGVKGKSEFS